MRAFRWAGVLGAVFLALGLFTAAVAVTPHPAHATTSPLAPVYRALLPGEIVSARTPSAGGEIIADGRTPGVVYPPRQTERSSRYDTGRVHPPQPRPRGDRGPPAASSP